MLHGYYPKRNRPLPVVGGDKTHHSSTSWVITLPEDVKNFSSCLCIYPVIYMQGYIAAAHPREN